MKIKPNQMKFFFFFWKIRNWVVIIEIFINLTKNWPKIKLLQIKIKIFLKLGCNNELNVGGNGLLKYLLIWRKIDRKLN